MLWERERLMKLIHITDTHFVRPDEMLLGLNPKERLDTAITDINRHHGDADLAVITGDLTHWGHREAFESLKDSLSALSIPVKLILGNHDERTVFKDVFPGAVLDENGFVQEVVDTPAGRMLLLDTNLEGTHAGWYCNDRLAWLDGQLDTSGDLPLFLFMHHPPCKLHLEPMDQIGLVQSDAFRDVVEPHAHKVRHIFFGHIHRPVAGSWLDIPMSTIRSTNHQVWLDFSARDTIPGSSEPPAYAIAIIDDDSVVVHMHDYLDASEKYEMGGVAYSDWQAPDAAE